MHFDNPTIVHPPFVYKHHMNIKIIKMQDIYHFSINSESIRLIISECTSYLHFPSTIKP